MPVPPKTLTPKHRQAIRLIVLGMPVGEVAALFNVSFTRMSQVYRCDLGQAFALHLEALANDYVARMLALGLTPRHISSAKGGGIAPERTRVRKRHGKQEPEPPLFNDGGPEVKRRGGGEGGRATGDG